MGRVVYMVLERTALGYDEEVVGIFSAQALADLFISASGRPTDYCVEEIQVDQLVTGAGIKFHS